MNENLLIIETTVESQALAKEISATLVKENLAACVQVSTPITSTYLWEGEICETCEIKISIKSIPHHYKAIEETIFRLHPFEVPELIAYHDIRASRQYRDWVYEVCNV